MTSFMFDIIMRVHRYLEKNVEQSLGEQDLA